TDSGAGKEVERVANLPVDRLRLALLRASHPFVASVEPDANSNTDQVDTDRVVRIKGRNLLGRGLPRVSIAGQPVHVLNATDREILIAPESHHRLSGMLSIETEPGRMAEKSIDLPPSLVRTQQQETSEEGGQP